MKTTARTNHLGKTPSELDWARLAAYIDGEGCISIGRTVLKSGKIRTYLQLSVSNTNPVLSEWIKQNFGGSIHFNRPFSRNPKWSDMYKWASSCAQAVWILEGCLPFFIMKRDQAEMGIAHQKLCGRRFGSANVAQREELRNRLSLVKGKSSRRGRTFIAPSRESEATA